MEGYRFCPGVFCPQVLAVYYQALEVKSRKPSANQPSWILSADPGARVAEMPAFLLALLVL